MIAGLLWFLLFAAGILVDSAKHRKALGWQAEKVREEAAILGVGKLIAQSESSEAVLIPHLSEEDKLSEKQKGEMREIRKGFDRIQAREQKGGEAEQELHGRMLSEMIRLAAKKSEPETPTDGDLDIWAKIGHFLAAMLLFIPTNVALLTLLAGFVGGCASNEADLEHLKRRLKLAEDNNEVEKVMELQQRLAYLGEHPAYSMIRAMVVYLVFVSGLYIAAADPFSGEGQTSQLAQYLRLAGLLSLLGFVVGYDPSRFRLWLDLVPTPAANTGGIDKKDAEKNENGDQPPLIDAAGDAVVAIQGGQKAVGDAQADLDKVKENLDAAAVFAKETVQLAKNEVGKDEEQKNLKPGSRKPDE
ncbi:hypothetical protein [Luteolibacter sp. Populi]|uniref:hypothetical protein n=1 Tax=Luteolibacter sp. Populi TaxID=3230487 RepID=UPI003465DD79